MHWKYLEREKYNSNNKRIRAKKKKNKKITAIADKIYETMSRN